MKEAIKKLAEQRPYLFYLLLCEAIGATKVIACAIANSASKNKNP